MSRQFLKRLHKGAPEGYCRICGEYAKLSSDHFPPKCTGNKNVTWLSTYSGDKIQCQKGVTFKTICIKCNNTLGHEYDTELAKIYKDLNQAHSSKVISPVVITINTDKLLKSLTGHLLSLVFYSDNISTKLAKPLEDDIDTFKRLRDFYQNSNKLIDFDIFYWFHNGKYNQISYFTTLAKFPQFHNKITGHILKFNFMAFLFLDKTMSTILPSLERIDIEKETNVLNFNLSTPPSADLFNIPDSDEILLFNNHRSFHQFKV